MNRPNTTKRERLQRARATLAPLAAMIVSTALMALAPTGSPPPADEQQQVKVPEVIPPLADVKTTWVAPPKEALPDDEAAPLAAPANQADRPVVKLPEVLAAAAPAVDDQTIHFDEPGDGALWVRGASYKASFSATGFTYIPFLGANAPQNYPVTLTTHTIFAGGEAVQFDAAAHPARTGQSIAFDRGTFTEVYEISLNAIEQMFVFDQPVSEGELVIKLNVQTELAAQSKGEHLQFANERGAVRYTKAIVLDAAGASAPAPTSWQNGAIHIHVPAAFLSAAVYPVTIDPVVDTFAIVGTHIQSPASARLPDVAFDVTNNRYLVAWERNFTNTDGDVWAQAYSASGSLIAGSGAYIDFTGDNWRNPKVANNNIANQFLVVAERGPSGNRDIVGRTRLAASTSMGSQFQIDNSEFGDKLNPDVGGDPVTTPPTFYCVVWQRVFASDDHDIHARLVESDSTFRTGTLFIDNTIDTLDRNPSISKSNGFAPFSTQRWNIVWQRQFDPSPLDEDIRGAQVTWDGVVTTPSFSLDFSALNDRFPEASSPVDGAVGERDYMVVYTRGASGSQDIMGRVMNGAASQAFANLASLGAFTETQNQILPAVDTDGRNYAVIGSEAFSTSTTDYDVYISNFCREGSSIRLIEGFQNLAFSIDAETQAKITSVHSGGGGPYRYMAAWRDADNANSFLFGDIEGGLYDSPLINEECADAITVIGGGTYIGALTCASADGSATCGSSDDNSDAWYRFVVPSHGLLRADTCGTHDSPGVDQGMDTVLSLHTGCPGMDANQIACDDDAGPPACAGGEDSGLQRDSVVQADVFAGEVILIRVSHFLDAIDDGNFELHINFFPDPCAADFNGDNFVNAADLAPLLGAWSIPPGTPGCGGASPCPQDLNGDGFVNAADLAILLGAWGFCLPL